MTQLITADTPLFMLRVRDPQEGRFCFVVMRKDHSPHEYDWRSLLTQWDGRDDAEHWERFQPTYNEHGWWDAETEEAAARIWRDYPLNDYGQGWDEPEM